MPLTSEQIEIMKEDMSAELIALLAKDYHLPLDKAMDVLYNSKTFNRLEDEETGLYFQSPGYVYSFIQSELKPTNSQKKHLPN